MTTPLEIQAFNGLNLTADELDVGASGAVDVNNVDVDIAGRIRSRPAILEVSTRNVQPGRMLALSPMGATSNELAAVRFSSGTIAIDRMPNTGGVTSLGVGWAASCMGTPVKLSTPLVEALYVPTSDLLTPVSVGLRKWTGTVLSTVAGKPLFVSKLAEPNNRLIQAGFQAAADSPTGANGSRSTVFFSDPGAPETWSANNYLDLSPGDGETICAAVAWNNAVFIFKQTALFIVYGEHPNTDGQPVFDYRRVELPQRVQPSKTTGLLDRGFAAGPDGVYYLSTSGLCRTSGGTPSPVSTPVDAIFDGTSSTFTAYGSGAADGLLGWVGTRLYVAYLDSLKGYTVLVWDTGTNSWTSWTVAMSARPLIFTVFGAPQVIFGETLAQTNVSYFDPNFTADLGTTGIAWSYKSGKYPVGQGGLVSTTLESSVVGSGTVALRLDSDLYSNQNGSAVLANSPAVSEGWPANVDQEGTWLQHTLSGTTTGVSAGAVQRLTHFVRSSKPSGVR